MPWENGEYYAPLKPNERGKFDSFNKALASAYTDLLTEKNEFFDSLADKWDELFPTLPAKPGRADCGKIFIYVKNAPTSFVVRPKLRMIARKLAELPHAPKKIDLRLEIHST